MGSNTVVEAGGKKIRGRMYPWGIVEGKQSNLVNLNSEQREGHELSLYNINCYETRSGIISSSLYIITRLTRNYIKLT